MAVSRLELAAPPTAIVTTRRPRDSAPQHRSKLALWLSIALLAAGWLLESPPGPRGVEATLWPKARICFNSMSSSFQSECVYCDSRLYANTISACTGQPVLADNITQAQAFCIATACLQQTGKQPVVLGRRKRSLQFRPLSLVASKQKQFYGATKTSASSNSNVTAQFDKSLNGTTSGQLAFVLNRPQSALWLNPLTRVLTRNATNKNLQWQFGRGQVSAAVAAKPAGSAPTTGAGSAPASAAKPAAPAASPPKPAAAAPATPPANAAAKPPANAAAAPPG